MPLGLAFRRFLMSLMTLIRVMRPGLSDPHHTRSAPPCSVSCGPRASAIAVGPGPRRPKAAPRASRIASTRFRGFREAYRIGRQLPDSAAHFPPRRKLFANLREFAKCPVPYGKHTERRIVGLFMVYIIVYYASFVNAKSATHIPAKTPSALRHLPRRRGREKKEEFPPRHPVGISLSTARGSRSHPAWP